MENLENSGKFRMKVAILRENSGIYCQIENNCVVSCILIKRLKVLKCILTRSFIFLFALFYSYELPGAFISRIYELSGLTPSWLLLSMVCFQSVMQGFWISLDVEGRILLHSVLSLGLGVFFVAILACRGNRIVSIQPGGEISFYVCV